MKFLLFSCLILAISCSTTTSFVATPSFPNTEAADLLAKDSDFLRIAGWSFNEPLELAPALKRTVDRYGLERTPKSDAFVFIYSMRALPKAEELADSVWCQHQTMVRFIRNRLSGRLTFPPEPECPAFDAWANLDTLKGIEILFASPSTHDPVSSFGHTMIRLRYANHHRADASDPVYEIIALTDLRDNALQYVLRGVSGQYPLIFEAKSLPQVSLENRALQGRNIHRFDLNLTGQDLKFVMQRLWELERRAYLPYRFLDQNCSSYLLWFIQTALFDRIAQKAFPHSIAAPATVLDFMASIPSPYRNSVDESLGLEHSDPGLLRPMAPWLSWEHEEEHYLGIMKDAGDRIATGDVDPLTLYALFHARLKHLRLRIDYLERFLSDSELQRVEVNTFPDFVSLEALLETRKALYADEDLDRRIRLVVEQKRRTDNFIASLPRRPRSFEVLKNEEELLEKRIEFQNTAHMIAGLKKAARDHDMAAKMNSELVSSTTLSNATSSNWNRRSAYFPQRFVSVSHIASNSVSHGLGYSFSFWNEELGELRDHGMGALRSFQIGNLNASVIWPQEEQPRGMLEIRPVAWSTFKSANRWGWGLDTKAAFSNSFRSLRLDVMGGKLLTDPLKNPWMIGAFVHVSPRLSNGPDFFDSADEFIVPFSDQQTVALSGAVSLLVRYRIGSTGALKLSSRFTRELTRDFEFENEWGIQTRFTLELPLNPTESQTAFIHFSHTQRESDLGRLGAGIQW